MWQLIPLQEAQLPRKDGVSGKRSGPGLTARRSTNAADGRCVRYHMSFAFPLPILALTCRFCEIALASLSALLGFLMVSHSLALFCSDGDIMIRADNAGSAAIVRIESAPASKPKTGGLTRSMCEEEFVSHSVLRHLSLLMAVTLAVHNFPAGMATFLSAKVW